MSDSYEAIFEILKDITEVGGPSAPRVFVGMAPQNAARPYIVYQESDAVRTRSINTQDCIAGTYIQVDCYDDLPFGASRLGNIVEETLVDYRGVVAYGTNSPRDTVRIAGVSFQNGANLVDQTQKPFLHRSYAVYLVTYEQ